MKNAHSVLLLFALFLATNLKAQEDNETVDKNCKDLFFSELTFGKNPNGNIWDLNYAVEIFNPTPNTISLTNYSLELKNSIGAVISIPLNDSILSGDVHVVCNANAGLNLQSMADELTNGLNFENNVILSLKNNGVVIDKIGQSGTSTNGPIDFVQLIIDPYNYLLNFHIDLNDFENVSIGRKGFVTHGEPDFDSANLILKQWGYTTNTNMTDLGKHLSLCNKPTGSDLIEFEDNSFSIQDPATPPNDVDPLLLKINGQSGTGQQLNNPGLTLNYEVTLSNVSVCNTGAVPNPELNWNISTACGALANTVLFTSNTPKVKRTTAPLPIGVSGFINFKLSSSLPNTVVTFNQWSNTHFLTLLHEVTPSSTNDINDAMAIQINPNIITSDLNINLNSDYNYAIFDFNGKALRKGNVSKGITKLNLSYLPNGIYQIIFISKDGHKFYRRFTKM